MNVKTEHQMLYNAEGLMILIQVATAKLIKRLIDWLVDWLDDELDKRLIIDDWCIDNELLDNWLRETLLVDGSSELLNDDYRKLDRNKSLRVIHEMT